jgi:hypothetical protein
MMDRCGAPNCDMLKSQSKHCPLQTFRATVAQETANRLLDVRADAAVRSIFSLLADLQSLCFRL